MQYLTVILVLIGLSMALLPVDARQSDKEDLLDQPGYQLLHAAAQYYQRQIEQQAKIEAANPYVRICCTNLKLINTPFCNNICRRQNSPPNLFSSLPQVLSRKNRIPLQQAQTQDIAQLLPLFTNLVRTNPSIRQLVTGLISEFSSYINRTDVGFTLADLLNAVRIRTKDFDEQMITALPTILERIKDFLFGANEDEPPTVIEETVNAQTDEDVLNKFIQKPTTSIKKDNQFGLNEDIKDYMNELLGKTQGITSPSSSVLSDKNDDLCQLLRRRGKNRCQDILKAVQAQIANYLGPTISLPNEGQGYKGPILNDKPAAEVQEQQPDPDKTELEMMQELEEALSDLEEKKNQ